MRQVGNVVLVHAEENSAPVPLPESPRNTLRDVLRITRLGCVQDQDVIRLKFRHCRVLGGVVEDGEEFWKETDAETTGDAKISGLSRPNLKAVTPFR